MPVYEYACEACQHEFEEWQKMADAPVKICPKCGEEKVQRLISRSSFQLKGGGWYGDLYASTKGKAGAPAGGAPAGGASSGDAAPSSSSSSSEGASSTTKAAEPAAKPATPAASKTSSKD